jgi:hypothetical protein
MAESMENLMASLERPDGYKPRIMEIRLSRETVPGIAVSLVKGELVLQGFQIVRAAGDTTPIAISEAELLAPTEALYQRIEEHEGMIGQFWVREDRP